MTDITEDDISSTHGMSINRGSAAMRSFVELLSSMRFAIALLTLICIASIIGTVLKQHEPINNYINQFGPFWAQVFAAVDLYTVYSAWWFLLILAFLVTSTSLCIARNTPKIMAGYKDLKENIREQSLKAFGHKASAELNGSAEDNARRIGEQLAKRGWKVKLQKREAVGHEGWMVAAKAGSANKIGYIAAHSAIVLVCLGGLLDGDLIVRAQMWFGGKQAYSGGGLIKDIPEKHRLSISNPTYRGNILVSEGTQSSTAILNQPSGVLLQELPFSIELKKFVVEHYSTGMPKLFASDIVIHDKQTGQAVPARVEVNHPVNHRGVEIYQSSFDDGGSTVKLKAVGLNAATKPFDIEGVIGDSKQITNGNDKLTLEFSSLRVINVENFGKEGTGKTDVRGVDLKAALDERMGAANKTKEKKELRNIGPSITYRLRDAAGQANEFHNYMLPVEIDGANVFLLGMRTNLNDRFSYLRVPADDKGSLETFALLNAALRDPAMRKQAVARYVSHAIPADKPQLAAALQASAARALDLFAGANDAKTRGLQALGDFMESSVPEAERSKASDVLVRILNGVLFDLTQISRAKAGLSELPADEKTQSFMTSAVIALSDAHLYPAPMAFMLSDFQQVQASVFQVARAPGKNIVYLGCLLLILGVFAMLYIRERRLWVWLAEPRSSDMTQTASDAKVQASMALSSNRQMMDTDKEFAKLKQQLLGA